ncbi:hypothetical protein DAEQUDRAFT_734140 [Daedalea quercina L-15889]|uniref:Uncharacterized protein n=1 Tax=Daedalea quercina L-15889 TaxID=1314783 RepID=A0A165KHX5_9APHY|nr:hypothetical protein DAEQUDRAFT_734140 [Daedalea quercina L-15889]
MYRSRLRSSNLRSSSAFFSFASNLLATSVIGEHLECEDPVCRGETLDVRRKQAHIHMLRIPQRSRCGTLNGDELQYRVQERQ